MFALSIAATSLSFAESLSDNQASCTTIASYPYSNAQIEYYFVEDASVYLVASVSAKICTGRGMIHSFAEAYTGDSDGTYNAKASASASVWSPYGYHTGTAATDSDTAGYTLYWIEFLGLYTNVYASQIDSQSGTASWSAYAQCDVY